MSDVDKVRVWLGTDATTRTEECNGNNKGESEGDGDAVCKGAISKIVHQTVYMTLVFRVSLSQVRRHT